MDNAAYSLKDDSACACGRRMFAFSSIVVTCPDGRAFRLGSVNIAECLGCSARYVHPTLYPDKAGRKTLVPMPSPEACVLIESAADYDLAGGSPDAVPYHKVV